MPRPAGSTELPLDARIAAAIEVEAVEVPFTVVDRDGKPILDLTPAEVELRVDGVVVPAELARPPAPLADVGTEPANGPAAEPPAMVPASASALAPAEGGSAAALPPMAVAPASGQSLPARGGRTTILWLDQTSLRPGPRNAALRAVAASLAATWRPGDRALLAAGNPVAVVLADLTDDPQALLAGVAAAERLPSSVDRSSMQRDRLMRDLLLVELDDIEAPNEARRLKLEIEAVGLDEGAERRRAVAALAGFLAAVEGLPGEKSLLLLAAPQDSVPLAPQAAVWEERLGRLVPEERSPRLALQQLADETRLARSRLADVASAAGVVIHVLDGGEALARVSAEIHSASDVERSAELGSRAAASSELATLAAATGGRVFPAAAAARGLARLAEEEAATHRLLFTPTGGPDLLEHRLEVRVARPGAHVRHRQAYRRASTEQRLTGAAVAAAAFANDAGPVAARLTAGAARRGEKRGQWIAPLTVEVPLGGLFLLPAAGAHRGGVRIGLAVRDPSGRLVSAGEREVPVEIPNRELAAALAGHVKVTFELVLSAGEHRVGVALLDRVGDTLTTRSLPLAAAGGP